MILVLTTEAGDFSHLKFIDWLEYYKADYEILTGESIFNGSSKIKVINNQLFVNDKNFTEDVNVVFNRRWLTSAELPDLDDDKILNNNIKNTLSSELYELRNYFDKNLANATWIPSIKKLNVNKISILETAEEVGLNIPEYIITNSKKDLIEFYKTHKEIITKAIGNFPRNYMRDDFLINPIYTKIVTMDLIEKLSDTFSLSIFQKLILKQKEYRVLYFNEKLYTVELLTQENEFSKIDSRAKESEDSQIRLNRSHLPKDIEIKIKKLMKKVELNIGSIDLLQSESGEYHFLEINPVGQIGGYSVSTNNNIEKEIVEEMIKIDNEKNKRKSTTYKQVSS